MLMALQTRILALAALLAVSSMSASAAASDDLVIPFQFSRSGHIATSIVIDGDVEATAVIDTGANFPMIGADAAAAAGIIAPEDASQIAVLGMGGIEDRPLIEVGQLEIAGILFEAMPAALQTRNRFPGPPNVLPVTAFEGRTVDFDFQRKHISLYDGPPRRVRDRRSKLELRTIEGIYFAKVQLNRRTGWAMIDTGSNITYVNSAFADAAGGRRQEQNLELTGVTDGEETARTLRVRRLGLGRHGVEDFEVLVADPPIFEHLGLSAEPAMILGLDALVGFRVQIDRQRRQLVLSVPENEQGRSVYRRN